MKIRVELLGLALLMLTTGCTLNPFPPIELLLKTPSLKVSVENKVPEQEVVDKKDLAEK